MSAVTPDRAAQSAYDAHLDREELALVEDLNAVEWDCWETAQARRPRRFS